MSIAGFNFIQIPRISCRQHHIDNNLLVAAEMYTNVIVAQLLRPYVTKKASQQAHHTLRTLYAHILTGLLLKQQDKISAKSKQGN
jgi:hypothetical protein